MQAAWVTHDRKRLDPVNTAFYKAVTTANASYLRYALNSVLEAKDMSRSINKLAALVQTSCTVTNSLDGCSEPHTARGSLEPTTLMSFIEKVRGKAVTICQAHQLSESHSLQFIMEAVKMLYTLLKGARNTGQPFCAMVTWVGDLLTDPTTAVPMLNALFDLIHVTGTAAMAATLT